eukprot:jgi/Tetstr1/431363/TSEL_021054.t1
MASSPGSGASDTTLTLPTCSCRSGYSCDCDARASDRKEPEKRKYTWGKGSDEVAESDNGKVSSLISKRTSRDCIRLMLAKEASEQSPCCSRKCVHKLYTQCGEALVDAVLDRALTVYSGNQNRSFDRLAQVLRGGYESASDKFDYMFDHGGYLRSFDHRGPIYTCGRAWEVLHQVSKHRRLVIQRSVVDNEPTYIRQRKQYESRQTGPREHVRMFLEHFFSDDLGHVEIMPFHDGNSETFKKHLPPWMTKICVYYYYKSWAEDDNAILRDLATESEVKLASFDTFRRTWKEDFPDVTTPKVKRFSHCPICAAGKALRDQAREICTKDMTPEERQVHRQHHQLVRRQVRAEQKVHLERVRQERRDLNNAVFQSRLGHGNFFFFEIDSMDSAKTLLPHWVRIPKTVKPDMLLKYHLTCVKYDGYRPDDIYYYTNTIPHDSSTTCTLIWITIMKEIQHRGRKIPYIRIQMDNTVRENKNRNVAALCNWLVSIGICDVIHLVFLPVGHTHERVDQIFSRISLALSRSSAYTIEAFLDLVAKAFSPTPEIAELSFSLDFSEWLRPHFQDHIQDISKPHKFEFTRDDAAASGGSLRTALWSNTPLSEPVQILKSAPTGTPEIRAGRPLLYALCDKKKPDAVKVQRYLDDFKKVRSYITDLAVQWHFSPVERESWKNLLDDLDEMQTAPSAAFSGFWPQRKEEVDDFLREHGQTAPAEARHTMATNADLNNAEAARVEAEVRAQVLQDDSAFRGVHAGAKERLHDNTSPSDAKGSNLVVIDVSDTKGGKKPVDTSWEKCLTLPWKLVEAVPLSYAKAIHDASGSREVFNEDGTMVRKKCGEELFSSGEGSGNSRPSCSRNWRVLALRIDCLPGARRTPAHHRCLHPECFAGFCRYNDLRVLRWEDVSFLPTYLEFRFVKRKNDQHRQCGKLRYMGLDEEHVLSVSRAILSLAEEDELDDGDVVQRAVCKETGTAWAVKKFNAGTSRDAILKEIHILSQLDHANVLRPREYFDDDAGVALITELLVGEHLLECVADRGSYAEDDCRQIARNVLSALAHCHAKGVVHRDLKLENLVLSCNLDPCSIKIVDFGLSGQLLESEPFLTESCGTPACTAPEVLQRNASYGSSPDVWSVGCLIFTLLSGAPPFQARVLKSLVRDIRQGAFSMQDPAWELVSDSAKEFVKLLLQVEPKKRPTALAALEHSWLQE